MEMKQPFLIFLVVVIFISGCTTQKAKYEDLERHATSENIEHCFEDHADDTYEDALAHCQEEICGEDGHCFEEVEELSQQFKG